MYFLLQVFLFTIPKIKTRNSRLIKKVFLCVAQPTFEYVCSSSIYEYVSKHVLQANCLCLVIK